MLILAAAIFTLSIMRFHKGWLEGSRITLLYLIIGSCFLKADVYVGYAFLLVIAPFELIYQKAFRTTLRPTSFAKGKSVKTKVFFAVAFSIIWSLLFVVLGSTSGNALNGDLKMNFNDTFLMLVVVFVLLGILKGRTSWKK